jgi:formylglycine-generating enzyme required for sulfatase activity
MSVERLLTLGYQIQHIQGVKVILPPMVRIPGGTFLLGCNPEQDSDGYFDEMPQHEVTIDDFFLAKYPVTVAEYQCAVEAGALPAPEPYKIGGERDYPPGQLYVTWEERLLCADYPMRALKNWFQALNYIQWLAALTRLQWRFPTEAEWERAAKGTDGRRFPWGNEWDPERVQSRLGSEGTWNVGPVGMHPQGASPYGVEDMSGNVSEWTSSLYRHYPYDPKDGREDPTVEDEYAVSRGGSWLDDPAQMRTTYRDDDLFWDNTGFRLARSQ